ncbi:DVUA0089 family protein [Coleofasciculus sp. FACHB-SPT9]|uniref:DVUA0089 family protein n=1 Tax=Cyanophyceae TaxID=3028117 RepID=UPI001684EFAA|nr:DVUA0089 family protein [Coleofasciculus sp. FACHB-SPT9]MBD1889159.1 DVUA0089 family protein [Coleofasciculus sp. FACHB-SPT9]
MNTSTLLNKLSITTVGAALIVGIGGTAQAATFFESGDAGQTLNTAQNVGEGINVIQGTISPSNDADLFSFSWSGGLFNATTVGGAIFDTILQLFDSSGTLLAQNDDTFFAPIYPSFLFQSTLNEVLDAGNYFLGISSFSNFASSGPTYNNNGESSGSYSISLNQPTSSVPEPGSVLGLLVLSGLGAGSVLNRKHQQKATVKG